MIQLHTKSNYSFLEGAIPVEDLVAHAEANGMACAALTDRNGMHGLINFAKLCGEKGIKPIFGTEIDDPDEDNHSAVFLAKNNSGYSQLCKIITTRKLKDDFCLLDLFKSELSDFYILIRSLEFIKRLKSEGLLRENIYAELIISSRAKKETRNLYEFCRDNSVKYCASQPALFRKKEEYILHKVISAIRLNTTLKNLTPEDLADEEFYLRSPAELSEIWNKVPEAMAAAEYIADNCNVDLKLGEYKFPLFDLPEGETAYSYLWKICFDGLQTLYQPISDKVVKRLQTELDVINELGFCDYFLVVWDIVREAHKRQMVTIGRGSAANSLVAYCLGMTQVDPVEQNLYFERFLNKARTSPPDVDLDFSWRERDEIVKYVFDKYGYDKVAMISTTVTFRARSAFRETAKVFGIPNEEISRYSKFIPWTSAKNLPVLTEKFPESRSLKLDDELWKSIIDIASKLGGFPRHLSIHPSGIVVTPNPISEYVALEYAKNKGIGLIVTQPDMYPIEDMGLIKIDLLSQRSLGVLRDTLAKIQGGETDKDIGNNIYDITSR